MQFPFRIEQDWPDLGTRFRRLMERLSFARHSLDHLVRTGYDAVIVNKPFDFPILWRGHRKGLDAQTLFRSGGTDFFAGDRIFAGAIRHWVSASRYNAAQIAARYGRRVQVIHNGVDADLFRPQGRNATLRRSLGAAPDDCLLASAGRLVGWKGTRVVIEALAQLPPRFRGLVIGEGPEEQRLRELAGTLGIGDRVRFIGRVPHAELPLVLSQCNLFAQPSIGEEAFGISVVEAMACGLPVLASNNGGLPEIVVEGETGHLLPPGEIAPWRDTIARIGADGALLDRLGSAGRSRAEAEFTWAANAEKLEAILAGGAPCAAS